MLLSLGVGANLLGVSTLVGGLCRRSDESRSQALDLLAGLRADVVRVDDGAEPASRRDRLETGHADTEDQHLGRRDGAGGGHHHRQGPGRRDGGDEHCGVAGEVRLG